MVRYSESSGLRHGGYVAANEWKCQKCGTLNVKDSLFCYECGSQQRLKSQMSGSTEHKPLTASNTRETQNNDRGYSVNNSSLSGGETMLYLAIGLIVIAILGVKEIYWGKQSNQVSVSDTKNIEKNETSSPVDINNSNPVRSNESRIKQMDELQRNMQSEREGLMRDGYKYCRNELRKSREQCIDEMSRAFNADLRKYDWAF